MTAGISERRRSTTAAFFDALAQRGRHPLLKNASGTIRFDVLDGERTEHWLVTMDQGDVDVTHARTKADAVVRIDKASLDGMVSGRVNAMASVLRGELVLEGDLSLMILFQRVFPGAE